MMNKVLFVVSVDKWTEGFYKFIKLYFTTQENWFVFYGPVKNFAFSADDEHCFWCESSKGLMKQGRIKKLAKTCDAIIYSGIFGCERAVLYLGLSTLKKSYFHLWGGDYTCFGNMDQMKLRRKLLLSYRKFILVHAKAIINLIPNEYDAFNKLCKIRGQHLIAPMPDDGTRYKLLSDLHFVSKSSNPILIQVGNSATSTNCHIEILKELERFKNEDIKIICPLSYGEKTYAEQIEQLGKKIFGDKFFALKDYMPLEEYYKLLAKVQVAIFNNDRQQAMGNINAAAALGCRVYIRHDTPMWQAYSDKGFVFSDVERIADMEFDEFIQVNEEDKQKNYQSFNKLSDGITSVNAWKAIFDSI